MWLYCKSPSALIGLFLPHVELFQEVLYFYIHHTPVGSSRLWTFSVICAARQAKPGKLRLCPTPRQPSLRCWARLYCFYKIKLMAVFSSWPSHNTTHWFLKVGPLFIKSPSACPSWLTGRSVIWKLVQTCTIVSQITVFICLSWHRWWQDSESHADSQQSRQQSSCTILWHTRVSKSLHTLLIIPLAKYSKVLEPTLENPV